MASPPSTPVADSGSGAADAQPVDDAPVANEASPATDAAVAAPIDASGMLNCAQHPSTCGYPDDTNTDPGNAFTGNFWDNTGASIQ